MQFNEEKAQEIISKFDLDPKTIRVWKSRDKIPDKYFSDDYQKPVEASKSDLIIQQRIFKAMETGYLQLSVICELAGVKREKYMDVQRGKVSAFSAQEVLALKKEITKIKLLIVKTFEKKSTIALRALLESSAILVNPILKDGGADKLDYDRVSRFKRRVVEIDAINYELVKDCFIKAALQLST